MVIPAFAAMTLWPGVMPAAAGISQLIGEILLPNTIYDLRWTIYDLRFFGIGTILVIVHLYQKFDIVNIGIYTWNLIFVFLTLVEK